MLFFSGKTAYCNKQKGCGAYSGFPPDRDAGTRRKRVPYATLRLKGSLTLEAALIIPFFLAAIFAVMFFIMAVNLQVRIQAALYNNVMKSAGYAYFLDSADCGKEAQNFLAGAYVKAKIIDELGEDYLENSILKDGKNGIRNILTYNKEDGIVDVVLTYELEVPYNIFCLPALKLSSRARVHTWTGADAEKMTHDEERVYVTKYGMVYHLSQNCSYLKSNIMHCTKSEIADKRNKDGSKYYPCSRCGGNCRDEDSVLYTDYGTRYHLTPLCSALYSNVYSISLKEAKTKYVLCSRCEKKNKN